MVRVPRANPPALKRFGQHFLDDVDTLQAIAAAAAPEAAETVIEIGPGRGALTDLLARSPNRLVVVEIDHALSAILREKYSARPQVTVIEQDVLLVDVASLANGPFVVVGNVPYYITTPILFHVLRPPLPRKAVFLVQLEVAERIVSMPGLKAYGALSANIQAISNPEIVRVVPPKAFRPAPRVHSAVLTLTPRSEPVISPEEIAPYRAFVQSLFGMRRKQLGNSLRSAGQVSAEGAAEILVKTGIDPRMRAESLSPAELAVLMRASTRHRQTDQAGDGP